LSLASVNPEELRQIALLTDERKVLARRLLFTATQKEYHIPKAITVIDFDIGRQEEMLTKDGTKLFCRLS
jgi:hypothetical protein